MEKVKKMMCEQNGNFNKEKENLKGKPKRMSRAEKYYNPNEKFTREIQRQICTEKRIIKLEYRTMKIIKSENRKKKILKKNEDNLTDLWNTIKWTNMCTVGVPEGERIFDEIMVGIPTLIKVMNITTQEAQETPSKMS